MSLFISEATARRNAALAIRANKRIAAVEIVQRTMREADRSASSGFAVILRDKEGRCIGHL